MKMFSTLMPAMTMLMSCTLNAKENDKSMTQEETGKILFINGSPNADGNTAALAKVLLEGRAYETLNLNDYRINFYGQKLEGDRFEVVPEGTFKGKRFFFLYQGAAPTQMMIDDGVYTMKRFAMMYGFSYEGMANDTNEAKNLKNKLEE